MDQNRFNKGLVYTIRDLCRVCFTCVRECPVKAIKIINGQAEVLDERCIGCGNCTKVCSQGAKIFIKSGAEMHELLSSGDKVAALIAPSFPAEFEEISDYKLLVGMMRALGFSYVLEVAFGADLVSSEYRQILENEADKSHISSDCPAIVACIEQYHPHLIPYLVPVVSPMIAMSRVAHQLYGEDLKIVFIGPCVAKKAESKEIDSVLTFSELREEFAKAGINSSSIEPSDFDEPKGGKGALFPVSRGMLQTINLANNQFDENIIVADGRILFQEALKEFDDGVIEPLHLELLCCEGCIMGPGMSRGGKPFTRRSLVNNYMLAKLETFDEQLWKKSLNKFIEIDLSRSFRNRKQETDIPSEYEIDKVLRSMGKMVAKDHLDCGACGYDTCRNHAIAIVNGLAETEMCLPYSIEKLHKSVKQLAVSNDKLASVQQALKQSEKLAHMGQLSAGIAHELNNPLGVVMMYTNILLDECPPDSEMRKDLELIVEQSARCKKIVGGLLNFARKNQVNHTDIQLQPFTESCIQSVIIPEKVKILVENHLEKSYAQFDFEQMTQVITNLIKNSVESMPDGGEIKIILEDDLDDIFFTISDTGSGIMSEDQEKVFEPFFTTKGLGKGTGLGLATAYGIVKMHKGQITLTSNAEKSAGPTGTTFRIQIPRMSEDSRENIIHDKYNEL
jgi:iron only hydrogenase large subunit-like protein/nitrogen-specific signal transduction histidine kinase